MSALEALETLPEAEQAYGADDPGTGELARYGYRTEEFLIHGRAGGGQFTTRLLVRRPGGEASGVAVLEPMHLAGGRPVWRACHDYLLRNRHTWAEVACQTTPAHAMARWQPDRYRAVDLPGHPSTMSATDGTGTGLRERSDRFARQWWDTSPALTGIVSAAIESLRPFARTVVLTGSSQSGGVVRRYADAHACGAAPALAAPDGFLPLNSGGRALRRLSLPTVELIAEADLEAVRSAAGLPGQGRGIEHRAGDPAHYVVYEVPGMSHVDSRYRPPVASPPPGSRWSRFPHTHVVHAVMDALVAWARDGTPPPPSRHIETESGDCVRDRYGHATGGLRTPAVELPPARLRVISPGAQWTCGHEYPLAARRDLGAAGDLLDHLVEQRLYLPRDAARWIEETRREPE